MHVIKSKSNIMLMIPEEIKINKEISTFRPIYSLVTIASFILYLIKLILKIGYVC